MPNRPTPSPNPYLLMLAAAMLAFLILSLTGKAHAADPTPDRDPDLWVYKVTPLKNDRLDVTLSNGYRDVITPCRVEDGRRCYWLAHERGNKAGRSFIVMRGTRFYLNLRGL